MVIRRSFGFCASHIVRNCTSRRCAGSLHGHNYKVEIFVSADSFDSAGMVLDFGIFKNQIADFIDGFDHAHHFWDKESLDFTEFVAKHSARYVKLSLNPSAENYALLILFYVDKIFQAMEFGNSEGNIWVESVRVHETDHGYAEAFKQDLSNPNFMKYIHLDCVWFSDEIRSEWKNPLMLEDLKKYHQNPLKKPFKNLIPPHQIKIQC
ncbi:6-pyruvoyl tetrahydropterin synthase family protein [Helicobacter sp. 11S03491-1]|uniref:6-pyruvoyl trahydropterin synthase family protein n=1 Tax=Helicobacter sp. 11S03491-1 TaxID=1476196 RepID=UPI000BA73E24|nr:6-pyruvoyl tetrahydropterin synthase family protein [Helicobacter sp. 11S03491-1]PAF41995.1 hypothetical protein BKH45_05285 [Helicobacter sp. 11S03491-1]